MIAAVNGIIQAIQQWFVYLVHMVYWLPAPFNTLFLSLVSIVCILILLKIIAFILSCIPLA